MYLITNGTFPIVLNSYNNFTGRVGAVCVGGITDYFQFLLPVLFGNFQLLSVLSVVLHCQPGLGIYVQQLLRFPEVKLLELGNKNWIKVCIK